VSEPTILYCDGDEVTVYAPSEVRRMIADGWSLTNGYVPLASNSPFSKTIANPPFSETIAEAEPAPEKRRRGRPRKAQL